MAAHANGISVPITASDMGNGTQLPAISLEARIEKLESLRAVDDLIVDLGRAFDAGPSAAALRPLFSEDAVFVIDQYDTLEGREAIAEGVAGNSESGFCWTLHYLVSPRIELFEDGAGGNVDFYLWEVATSSSGKSYWIGGRYEAQVVADKDRWRFSRLELKAELISHYPEGWREKPDSLAAA